MGNIYLWISLAAWIGLLIFFNINLGFFKGMVSFLWHLIFFSAMILVILITLPQLDKTPVIKKIFKKNFPTRESINHGLTKLGITSDKIKSGIDKNINRESKKLKKN